MIAKHIAQQCVVAPRRRSLSDRLTAVRERERRRLLRDLHDGVGPTLASTILQAEVALVLLDSDPEAAGRAVGVVVAQTRSALAELGRIVGSLRPPALDQAGLVQAIRDRVSSFELAAAAGRRPGFAVRVSAEPGVERLPAGVEVAAFAIVSEAVTNAARHSGAARCLVWLRRDDALRIEVSDDGAGIATGCAAGMGLASMRERAAELGGGCVVARGHTGGTVVRAWLPLPS